MKYTCPVCGWPEIDEDPTEHTYEICPCCGCEFGYSDVGRTLLELRNYWVGHDGMKWWSEYTPPPDGWNAEGQLDRLYAGLGT